MLLLLWEATQEGRQTAHGSFGFYTRWGEDALQSSEWQSAMKTIGVERISTCSQEGNLISGLILTVKPKHEIRMWVSSLSKLAENSKRDAALEFIRTFPNLVVFVHTLGGSEEGGTYVTVLSPKLLWSCWDAFESLSLPFLGKYSACLSIVNHRIVYEGPLVSSQHEALHFSSSPRWKAREW